MDLGFKCEYEDENAVSVLTRGISTLMSIDCPPHKLDKYIKHLQSLCFGTPDDKFCKLFGSSLSQEECVDCFLSLGVVEEFCLTNPTEALDITQQLLCLTRLSATSSHFLASILPNLVGCTSIQRIRPTLQSLWKLKDKWKLPIALLECMLLERKPLEVILIKAYVEAEESVSWKDLSLSCWVVWGSLSSFVFQTVTTVLNNILLHSNDRPVSTKMVGDYVRSVDVLCSHENRHFCKLYPLEFQDLVVLLKSDPVTVKSDPCFEKLKEITVGAVKQLSVSNPQVALMLLSHFNKWLPIFNDSDLRS